MSGKGIFPEEMFAFIEAHRGENPSTLRMRYHDRKEAWTEVAINHIESLKKCGRKFSTLQPELMAAPVSVEQASSEAVAMFHGSLARRMVPAGISGSFLDMTCGLGIDFRAISESLGIHSTAIELNGNLAAAARYNFRHHENVEVIHADSVEWLGHTDRHFSLIFIDPARRDSTGKRLYNIHDCMPDVGELLPLLRKRCDRMMVKLSPMLDVAQTLADLPCAGLHIVDEGGDCRELLAVIDFTSAGENSRVEEDLVPIYIHTSGCAGTMVFTRREERESVASYGVPAPGEWLFEPSPAAMKGAPFKLLCERFGLRKLHVNTHLYYADRPDYSLPGKWHAITEVLPFSSSLAKEMSRKKMRADVATRNFPIPAAELCKRLGIKGGGMCRIVGATAADDRRYLIKTDL